MTSTINSRKRQTFRTTCWTHRIPVNFPISQWLRRELVMSGPFKSQSPRLVSNMVAYPVIFTHVDENSDVSFQKSCDVMLSRVIFVQIVWKVCVNPVVAWGEIAGYCASVDTE